MILNISADHLERHGNLKKYISAKFRLLENQKKDSIVFLNKNDLNIKKKIKSKKYNITKILVNTKNNKSLFKDLDNEYFDSEVIKKIYVLLMQYPKLRLNKIKVIRTLNNFKVKLSSTNNL